MAPAQDNHTTKFIGFAVVALVACSLGQLSSWLVNENLAISETYEFNSVIWITHIRNFGGIFGSLEGMGWLFAILGSLVMAGISWYLFARHRGPMLEFLCYGAIVGGGLSNIVDRLVYGSVVDFINVQGIPYWHYIFNTADVLIHVGIWPLILSGFWLKPDATPAEK